MPRHRPPRNIWFDLRYQMWLRDEKHWQRPFCWDETEHWPSVETIAQLNRWIATQEENIACEK